VAAPQLAAVVDERAEVELDQSPPFASVPEGDIAKDLREAGWRVSEKTVGGIMRHQHLVARATKAAHAHDPAGLGRWRAPDLIGRDFAARGLNQKWYGDRTEIVTTKASCTRP
jgi:transposase InsO family protein